ncbi:MAG: carbohydrate ABC transporter substrate-binding protein [SAR324 cluster bacterium]|nr:carbohydrate ABC transporter substrate-binding protein [SAR324 cluster bacterium]
MKFTKIKSGASVLASALAISFASITMAAEVEVIHWWTSGGEQAAVSVFADEFDKMGGDKWKDTAIAGGQNSRRVTMQRILGGDPPGAAQFNPGRQYEELIEGDLLLDLTDLAKKEGWAKFIRPGSILTNACIKNGKVWCVPVNIHSWQWGWVSTKVFKDSGIDKIPTNIQDFLKAAPKIKAAGFIPFAIGGENWQHTGAFNVVLVAQLGKEGYYRLFRDKDEEYAKSAEVAKVLETWRELVSYSDAGSAGRNWNDTTNLVITDKAGMQIMGDWAHGEFAVAKKVAGKDYECLIGPSDTPYITTDGDIFLFPKQSDPAVEAAQLKMASMMISKKVQVAFNLAKGSLPVRGDVDMSAVDSCMRKGIKLLEDPKNIIISQGRLLNEDSTGQLNDLFAELSFNPNLSIKDAHERFVSIIENAE